jgi:hypothetical protein
VIELSASIFTAYAGQVGSRVGPGILLSYTGAAVTFAILGTSSHPTTLGADFLIVA